MKRLVVVLLLSSLVLVSCGKTQEQEIQEHISELTQDSSVEGGLVEEPTEYIEIPEELEQQVEENVAVDSAVIASAETTSTENTQSDGVSSEDSNNESSTEDSGDVDVSKQFSEIEVASILDEYLATTEDTISGFADKYCVKPYSVTPAAPYGVTDYSVGDVFLEKGNASDYTYISYFHGLCNDYTGTFDRNATVTFRFHGNKLYEAFTTFDMD